MTIKGLVDTDTGAAVDPDGRYAGASDFSAHTGTSSIHAPIPAVISDGDIEAGTSTTQGTITAAGIKLAAETHAPGILATLGGSTVAQYKNAVLTDITGALATATHSGAVLVTSGNVTIPNGAGDVGFSAVIIAGGTHTVSFNGAVSAAMWVGDVMTVFVESTTQIRASLVPASNQVAFV